MERNTKRPVDSPAGRAQVVLVNSDSVHNRGTSLDPTFAKAFEIGFMVFFWCANVANIICFLFYVIPEYHSDYDDISKIIFKVVVVFVHIQIITHWVLTRQYESSFKRGEDYNYNDHVNGCQNIEHHVNIENNALLPEMIWKVCHICRMRQPPRSHHCKVCNVCILKRDHHCFMTGVCIGFRNQRYFVLLNFYIAIATTAGFMYSCLYMSSHLGPQYTGTQDFILPYIFLKWVTGQTHIQHVLFTFLLYSFCWSPFVSFGFFITQLFIIAQGKTLHEVRKGLTGTHGRTVPQNFQSVFGDYWALNFLFPVHHWFKQPGNGVDWTGVDKDS